MSFEPIANFQEANTELDTISNSILEKSSQLDTARENYLLIKAEYENLKARHLLESKVKQPNATQSEIAAQSVVLTHNERLEMIKAESKYKKLLSELRSLRDRLESLQEISYNLRKEASL